MPLSSSVFVLVRKPSFLSWLVNLPLRLWVGGVWGGVWAGLWRFFVGGKNGWLTRPYGYGLGECKVGVGEECGVAIEMAWRYCIGFNTARLKIFCSDLENVETRIEAGEATKYRVAYR